MKLAEPCLTAMDWTSWANVMLMAEARAAIAKVATAYNSRS